MLLSSDLPHNVDSPWKRFLLTATLLSFWAPPGSAQGSMATIPARPVEGGSVRPAALNLPARVRNATWYKGLPVQRTHTEFLLKPDISANTTVALELKDSVVFTCHTVEDSVRVLWYSGGLLLQEGERLKLSNNNRTLTVGPVRRYDGGLYFCRVWNGSDYKTSDTIFLEVLYGPRTIVMFSYPEIRERILVSDLNYSVVLQCISSANPDPLFTWSLNGNVCGTGDRHIIRRLTEDDLGSYTCTARNNVSQLTFGPIQVQLPKTPPEDPEFIEPDPIYSLSGAPAICLTVAGVAGMITFFGCILYAGINRKALKNGRNSKCGCF